MSFFGDILKDPVLMAALAGTAIVATGGLAAPAVAGAAGAAGAGATAAGATAAGGLLATEGVAAAAPTVLGAEAAGGLLADPIAAYTATGGVEGSIMGNGLTGAGGSSGAVGNGTFANAFGNAKNFASAVKPYGDAAGAAMQVKGLLSSPQQPHQQAQSTAPQYSGGSQILSQLAQQGTQEQQQTMQADAERRKRRMTLLGGLA